MQCLQIVAPGGGKVAEDDAAQEHHDEGTCDASQKAHEHENAEAFSKAHDAGKQRAGG